MVNPRALDLDWARGTTNPQALFTILVFYFGLIGGSMVFPILLRLWRKKIIYLFTSFFYLVSAIVMSAFPSYYYTVLISRLFIGFGHGIAQLTALVHGSEVAERGRRGYIIAEIHVNQMMSIFTAKYLLTDIPSIVTLSSISVIGLLTLAMSVVGFILIFVLVYESPIYTLQRGKDQETLDLLVRLRREKNLNPDIEEEFYEIKKMLDEDKIRSPSKSIFLDGNFKPLFIVFLTTLIFTLTYNYPINTIRFTRIESIYQMNLSSIIFTIIRILFMVMYLATFDLFQRRTILAVSGGAMGISLLALGIACTIVEDIPLWFGIVFYIFFEALGTNGIYAVTGVISAEVFASTKKPLSLAFMAILEAVIHIIFISWTFDATLSPGFVYSFLFVSSAIVLVIVVILFNILPRTANKSLRDARAMFWRDSERSSVRQN